MANFYTYGIMPSAEETVYGLAGLDQEPVYVPREESVPIAPLNEAPSQGPSFADFLRNQGVDVPAPSPPVYSGGPVVPPQDRIPTPTGNNEFISPLVSATTEAPSLQPSFADFLRQQGVDVTPPPPASIVGGPVVPPQDRIPTPTGNNEFISPLAPAFTEPPSYTPRGEDVPVSPLSTPAPATAPAPARYDEKGNLLPAADQSPGFGSLDWMKRMELFGAKPTLVPDLVTPGTKGLDISVGDLYKTKKEQAVKDYEAKVQRFKDAGQLTDEIDQSLKSSLNSTLENYAKEEVDYLNQLPQRQTLSNLLKENKFQEAYKFAQDNGMQSLLLRNLPDLREPFTKEEAKAFMRSMPYDFIKSAYPDAYKFEEAYKFDPEGAEERGAYSWVSGFGSPEGPKTSETGYPMLERILKPQEIKKDPGIFEKIFKGAALAAAIFGGAQALGALGGGGAGAGALTGVTPTGLVPGTTAANLAAAKAAAAGASALPTFTVTAGGGLTGAQLAALGAAGAGAGGLGGGAGTAPTTTTTPPADDLQQILVQATKPKSYSLLGPGTLASTSLIQGTPDVPVDIYGRPTEPPQPPEEEIVVRGTKPPVSSIDLAAVGGLGALGQTLSQQLGYKPPGLETTPVKDQGLPEVVVTGTKPPVLDIADVALGLGGAGALTAGFTQPQVDPLTGKLKEPPKTQQELDAIQEALRTGKPIPGTVSALDQAKSVLEKANTARKVANLLKSLGLLGAGAAAGDRGTAAPVTGAGGFGGALPKFQLQRTQLQPQVDYYRYGLGPEARFFEDKMVEVKPSEFETTEGPTTGIVNPKDRPPVFAEGGLAAGGRYMEGPGSGRDDKIPALLSDGEYVIDAETLALLGDGSPKEGAKRMDQFRANIRRHKGDALSRGRISPDAKSPSKYMGGGLT